MASSPFRPGTTTEDQLIYYKSQYEQLEAELHEFQASSKELEAELEKDVEESEKRERRLKEQVERLGFEVEEWKTKSKQSRDEANRSQNALQKEITTLRESSRQLQLRLRDIEVVNDDYERQARNTTSSLEDLESKYNIAIERSVLLDEEMREGEKEREQLRIENQRLRDELSDLRIEFEITVEKLQHTEIALERSRNNKVPLHIKPARPRTPSDGSAITAPSLNVSTPMAAKSRSSSSEVPTPPSPPLSDTMQATKAMARPTTGIGRKSLLPDVGASSRSTDGMSRIAQHNRGPPIALGNMHTKSSSRARPSVGVSETLPRSGSLFQIKDLIGRMQKMEQRVQSVRAKLPPAGSRSSTPRSSPRAGVSGINQMPPSVTVRSDRKRPSMMSTFSAGDHHNNGFTAPSANTDASKRLSFGVGSPTADRQHSPMRPSSRASNASSHAEQSNPFVRPSSRISMGGSGARPPFGQYPLAPPARPRSSMSGSQPNQSLRHKASHSISEESSLLSTPTTRRTTLDRSGIPTPGDAKGTKSTVGTPRVGFRTSSQQLFSPVKERDRSMRPPPPLTRDPGGLGETY